MNLGYSKDDEHATILAALLHDVGKFEQRSKNQRVKHAKIGYKFINDSMGVTWEKVAYLVSAHHNPSEYSQGEDLAKLVAVADYLSASEREITTESRDDVKSYNLHSIFSSLTIDGVHKRKDPLTFPLKKMSFDLTEIFPSKNEIENKSEINQTLYEELWKGFIEEFKDIDFDSTLDFETNDAILTSILSLMEKYTSFIPSAAYKSVPDISLYSHSKSVCALSACLLQQIPRSEIDDYYTAIRNKNSTSVTQNEIVNILLCDLSGIQDFLYNIKATKALKNLRGRSAYVQFFSDSLARFILAKYKLPIANIIFIGGGNFYLLVPAHIDIEKLKEEVSQFLFNSHAIEIAPIIDTVKLSCNDFLLGRIGEKWKDLHKAIAVEKRKKNKYILSDKVEGVNFLIQPTDSDSEQYNEISTMISNSHWLYHGHSHSEQLKIIDTNWFFSKTKIKNKTGFSINKFVKIDETCKGFYNLANHSASGDGNATTATLENLSNRCESGKKTWGVIRADVDHLGKIFREGLDQKEPDEDSKLMTLSRISTLSYLFSLFFSSHLQSILKREKYLNKTVVVYSGGDDLMIIGSWDILPELAYDIREDFKAYVGREDITISASIFVAPSQKYPIIEAAKEAGIMLEAAKNAGRNRICFLDKNPLLWDELDEIRDVKIQILSWIEKAGGKESEAKSLIRILYESLNYNKGEQNNLSHIFRFMYSLKRWTERQKQISDVDLADLRNMFVIDYKFRKNLLYAVRWTELLTRQES